MGKPFYLLSYVYARRTPCDTPSTAHTAKAIKLVHPIGKLMHKPLPITGVDALPDIKSVDCGKGRRKA